MTLSGAVFRQAFGGCNDGKLEESGGYCLQCVIQGFRLWIRISGETLKRQSFTICQHVLQFIADNVAPVTSLRH